MGLRVRIATGLFLLGCFLVYMGADQLLSSSHGAGAVRQGILPLVLGTACLGTLFFLSRRWSKPR